MACCTSFLSLVVTLPVVVLVTLSLTGDPDRSPSKSETAEASDEAVALQMTSKGGSSTAFGASRVRFIRNRDVLKELPQADKSLPASLRTVGWLDQAGVYGFASINTGRTFPDLCVSSGDSVFDPEKRTIDRRATSLGWQWFNSPSAYMWVRLFQALKVGYVTQYNEDYTFGQLYLYAVLPWPIGQLTAPVSLVNFTIQQLSPDPGRCPPVANATKEERSVCAAAIRRSRLFQAVPGVSDYMGETVYHIFKVGDENHEKVQPYFDAYLEYADNTTEPDYEQYRKIFGTFLGFTGKSRTSMVSTVGRD